MLHKMLDEKEV